MNKAVRQQGYWGTKTELSSLLEHVRKIGPTLEENAEENDKLGRLNEVTFAALKPLRMSHIFAGEEIGGAQMSPTQGLELLEQIGAEVRRLRDRRRVDAGLAELGEGARARGRRAIGRIGQAQFRIAEQGARRERGRLALLEKALDRAMQRLRRVFIEADETVDRFGGGFDPFERPP